jgi:hypothetical protein
VSSIWSCTSSFSNSLRAILPDSAFARAGSWVRWFLVGIWYLTFSCESYVAVEKLRYARRHGVIDEAYDALL